MNDVYLPTIVTLAGAPTEARIADADLDATAMAEWEAYLSTGDLSKLSPRSIFIDCTIVASIEDRDWIERACARGGAIALIDADPANEGWWIFHSMLVGKELMEKACARQFHGTSTSNGARAIATQKALSDARRAAQIKPRKPKPAGPKVYFIQSEAGGLIKIGWATCVKSRIRDIQAMCPAKLNVLGTVDGGRERESGLHKKFKHARQHGEWFEPSPDLLEFIASIENGTDGS